MKQYKYFEIIELPKSRTRKTPIYAVVNKSGGYEIGRIRWYGSWRQYCFFPAENTVWNDGCLQDILGFLAEMRRR